MKAAAVSPGTHTAVMKAAAVSPGTHTAGMKAAAVSPGTHTAAHSAAKDRRAERYRRRRSSEFKCRRVLMKDRRGSKEHVHEIRECTTYSAACPVKPLKAEEVASIPPLPKRLSRPVPSSSRVVVFDLETTSLECNAYITQIAASFVTPKSAVVAQRKSTSTNYL